jgi:hypothetical protein
MIKLALITLGVAPLVTCAPSRAIARGATS